MAPSLDPTFVVDGNTPRSPTTIEPYLQNALNKSTTTSHPVTLFSPINPPSSLVARQSIKNTELNNIFLFAGSYNPPHIGHLATIQYLSRLRSQLNITAFFIFADPSAIIATRNKKYGSIILPQELRNNMFANVLEIAELIAEGWLYILVGDMEGHITVLREMTDSISRDQFDARLVGFLGGDKLSIQSPPNLPPGDLEVWGPVDDFFIMNVRRPVDFYDPVKDKGPHHLPGCTEWERRYCLVEDQVGELWVCRALTVERKPFIVFRASKTSTSTGISSTRIRKVMTETSGKDLYQGLKDQVLSAELLVEWLEDREAQEAKVGDENVEGRVDSGAET